MKIPEKLYSKDTKGKFLFIRHGQTSFNKAMSEKGIKKVKSDPKFLDPELTKEGIEEGKKFSKNYENYNIEQIYVSPLYRTLQSAYFLFKNHPQKNEIIIKVHPLICEITNCVHDIPFNLINRNKKDFNMNSEIKFDWSLFDNIYKSDFDKLFFYFNNIDTISNDIKKEKYDIISKSYGKENYINNIIDLINFNFDKHMESPKHVFERFNLFKQFLRDNHKNTLNDCDKKVFVITHNCFLKCGTSKIIYNYTINDDDIPSDGCLCNNFDVVSICI